MLTYLIIFTYAKFHDNNMSQLGDIGKKMLKRCHLNVTQLGVVGRGSEWVRVDQSGSEWIRARFSTALIVMVFNFCRKLN